MKLSDSQRWALYVEAFRALVARPAAEWPQRSPPNREGVQKAVRPTLGVAVWAAALARDAAYVLEQERAPAEPAATHKTDSGLEAPAVPF